MTTEQNDPPIGNQKVAYRMTREDYLAMEKKFLPPNVNDETSVLNAGQRLGIQVVLAYFRTNFVQGL
jgi:hypothetical protein